MKYKQKERKKLDKNETKPQTKTKNNIVHCKYIYISFIFLLHTLIAGVSGFLMSNKSKTEHLQVRSNFLSKKS